ncbi:MAG: glycine cleavage system protein GcvH [Polyangiales bacterium]
MANYPADLKYTKDHEWAKREAEGIRVGITDFAVEQLGDVTLVDLPKVGTKLKAAGHFGDIESVKAVSELFSPIDGTVVAVNDELADHPELVNEAPYEKGWMLVIKPDSPAAYDALLDAAAYTKLLESLEQ